MAKPKFKKLSENTLISINLKSFYEFGYRFNDILLSHYLTREDLAGKMGISVRTMRRKTKDIRQFTVGEIMDIHTILEDQRRKLKNLAGG